MTADDVRQMSEAFREVGWLGCKFIEDAEEAMIQNASRGFNSCTLDVRGLSDEKVAYLVQYFERRGFEVRHHLVTEEMAKLHPEAIPSLAISW